MIPKFTVGAVLDFKNGTKKVTVKKWIGPSPKQCDICRKKLADGKTFVDGKTRMGAWANMCPSCFTRVGVGTGTGRGQKYCTKTNVKLEG